VAETVDSILRGFPVAAEMREIDKEGEVRVVAAPTAAYAVGGPWREKRSLEKRGEAAKTIGLVLDPAETMMLAAAPASQLEAIIDRTTVSPWLRQAFEMNSGSRAWKLKSRACGRKSRISDNNWKTSENNLNEQ
jgi:hypothetical protein